MENKGALNDLRVLDLTRVLAGPICTMWLAELGADVIKIERPGTGDEARGNPPFKNDISTFFTGINRSKRSITLNLKSDEGKEIFREMVKVSDVVVENYRPGVMDKLGLGYSELKKINEGIIYVAISGFGQEGPLKNAPAYDPIAQAMSGFMSINGPKGGKPYKAGPSIADVAAGMNGIIGLLAALHVREKTGKGQMIDVSLVDAMIALQQSENNYYFTTGQVAPRVGNDNARNSPYGSFSASDGDYMLACGNNILFGKLCRDVLNRPDLAEDPRFLTMSLRSENRDELIRIITDWGMQRTVEEAVRQINAAGVPAAPVLTVADISQQEHYTKFRHMFPVIEQTGVGTITETGVPIHMSESAVEVKSCAPMLGEHSEQILEDVLGYSAEKIAELKQNGTI